MTQEPPIFFIGCPRSGTTIIFEAFSVHEKLCWLSNYFVHFPVIPQIGLIQRAFMGIKGEKDQGQSLPFYNRILPKTAEVYKVWENFFGKEFSYTYLTEIEPNDKSLRNCQKFIKNLIKYSGKKTFTAKFTGPPRINYLLKIFPNAKFINIVRDPRAVVASLFNVDFWLERNGFEEPFWSGGLNNTEIKQYKESSYPSAALAALQWKKIINITFDEAELNKINLLTIKYEDFMKTPKEKLIEITKYSGTTFSKTIKNYMNKKNYYNMNYKYKKILQIEEIKTIEKICYKEMKTFNYM